MKKFIFLVFIIFLVGCSNQKAVTRSNLALDTIVSITIYKNGSEELIDRCFDIINDYDSKLDAFNEESLINQIDSTPKVVDSDIYSLLETNLKYNQKTNGLFSPTLGTLIKLWDINEPETKEPPSSEQIEESLSHTDINNLILDNQTVTILDPLEKINLGASSKGFIADKLKDYLTNQGIESALINLGGNVLLIGNKNGEDFKVGIDNPDNTESEAIATIEASNKSIVTSGTSQRYFIDNAGNIYHHLLNPKTGYPENNDLKEVVVISDSSLDADILSTSLYLMGKDGAINFLKKEKDLNIDVILVTRNNKIYITKNLDKTFKLEDNFKNSYQVELIQE